LVEILAGLTAFFSLFPSIVAVATVVANKLSNLDDSKAFKGFH
jgi:hypothetical protein